MKRELTMVFYSRLVRIMRMLIASNLFEELGKEIYRLTPLGSAFVSTSLLSSAVIHMYVSHQIKPSPDQLGDCERAKTKREAHYHLTSLTGPHRNKSHTAYQTTSPPRASKPQLTPTTARFNSPGTHHSTTSTGYHPTRACSKHSTS